jgi:hypothetical protein
MHVFHGVSRGGPKTKMLNSPGCTFSHGNQIESFSTGEKGSKFHCLICKIAKCSGMEAIKLKEQVKPMTITASYSLFKEMLFFKKIVSQLPIELIWKKAQKELDQTKKISPISVT